MQKKKCFFPFLLLSLTVNLCFAQSGAPVVVNSWGLLNPYGIDMSSSVPNKWEAGRINDVLEIGGASNSVLAAASTGGVWWLRSGGNWGVSVSTDWASPDMFSLAKGVSQNQYFAGGINSGAANAGALYQTDFTSPAPLLRPWREIPCPGVGTIYKVFVPESGGKIILGTQNGVWWSSIPGISDGSGYTFVRAALPMGCNMAINDITETSNNKFIISLRGGACPGSFLFIAGFTNTDQLIINPVTISNLSTEEMSILSTVSVASCKGQKETVYAVMAGNNGAFTGILKSTNGGTDFSKLPWQPTDNPGPGNQGVFQNNCIAVHTSNPNIVSFGWITGPYISTTGGAGFMPMTRGLTHDDKAALVFSEAFPNRLYICSDGGLASVNDINNPVAANMDYSWSRKLANLQFVDPAQGRWTWWGRFDIKQSGNNFFAGGGLQDNNNVYMEGGNGPWKRLQGRYDGGSHLYLKCGGVLWSNSGRGVRYWTGGAPTDNIIPIRTYAPGGNRTITSLNGVFCEITDPQKRNAAGQYMYALSSHEFDVTVSNGLNAVYGIFADPNGGDIHAEYLFTTAGDNEQMSAISSYDGIEIFIGKRPSGRIIKMIGGHGGQLYSQVNGNGIEINNTLGRYPARTIDVGTSSEAYALRNDDRAIGRIYYTQNGADWSDITGNLPATIIYSMDLFKNSCRHILFAITDDKVYACLNHSGVWTDISVGLPARVHCADIQVVENNICTTDIYLSTSGWSVWKTTLRN